jgi:hypothetical protein
MNTLEELAERIREVRRSAFWQGFLVGTSVMLVMWSILGSGRP